jgi:hypothetical protein
VLTTAEWPPNCVFTQVTPEGRWLILDELCGDDVGIGTFADCVIQMSAERFSGFKFADYGDPAGNQRSAMSADKDAKTCFDILRGKGIAISRANRISPSGSSRCANRSI